VAGNIDNAGQRKMIDDAGQCKKPVK